MSESGTSLYTEGFAAILAEHAPAPNPAPVELPVDVRPAPVELRSPIRGHQEPSFHGYEAALGGLLLLSIGATTWYEIVDPVWSTPITASRPAPLLHLRPVSTATLWPIESGTVLSDHVRATADEAIPATIDPILTRLSGVKTAAKATAASDSPPQTAQRPAPVLIASLVETVPNAPTSSQQSPEDTIGVRPANDLEKPDIGRNGEAKGPIGIPFVDMYPGEPLRALPSINTASRAGAGASQSEGLQPLSSAEVLDAISKAGPDTGSQHPHPGADAQSGPSQGQKESKSDKPGPGRSPTTGDKPAAAAKDKPGSAAKDKPGSAAKDRPAADKGAPAGPKDDRNLNGGKPSAGRVDGKGDGDKKDKPGKDKADKAKGKGPH